MIAVCITAGVMLLEFFGGILTNSLALLSDSGHMLSDLGSLLLSFIAILFAKRPSSPEKTYGYYRFEILAAFVNGITLFFLSGFIVWEAVKRFFDPPAVNSGAMIAIAFAGLTANLLSALVLMKTADVQGNINIRSAFLHVVGDALGSVGAIVAGFLMYSFGWYLADPAISVFVALLIMRSGWNVFNRSVHILMEGTPANIDQREVKRALEEIDGVIRVCDLHIWTITSGMDSLSCHLLVDKDCDCQKNPAKGHPSDGRKISHPPFHDPSGKTGHRPLEDGNLTAAAGLRPRFFLPAAGTCFAETCAYYKCGGRVKT